MVEGAPGPDGQCPREEVANDPADRANFTRFRRLAVVFDRLARDGELELGPIVRREEWRPPADAGLEDLTHMLDHGFELVRDANGPLRSSTPRSRPSARRGGSWARST